MKEKNIYSYTFPFEKLDVWKNAIELSKMVYDLTKSFPGDEKFGLTSQLRRSAVSVSSNIAEGTSRNTFTSKSHFVTVAFSSLMEVMSQLILANELRFIQKDDLIPFREKIAHISNQLNNLKKFYQQQKANDNEK